MKSRRMMTLAFCALVAAPLLSQSQMRPGRWEVTSQVEMPGMPVKIPANTTTSCVTPEEANNPGNTLGDPVGRGRGRGNSNCKATDQKVEGNKFTWKMACADKTTGEGEMVFDGDSYAGKMNMTMAQMPGPMTIQITGKRVGDCEK